MQSRPATGGRFFRLGLLTELERLKESRQSRGPCYFAITQCANFDSLEHAGLCMHGKALVIKFDKMNDATRIEIAQNRLFPKLL